MKERLFWVLFFLVLSISLFTREMALCEVQLEESRLLEIIVSSEGTATWTITRRYSIMTEDDAQVFQMFLSEFEIKKGEYLRSFSENIRGMIDRASNQTGRNMTSTDFEVDAGIRQTPTGSFGIVLYRYTWIGFAIVDDQLIRIGDVFDIGFLLLENDELTVGYPQGYSVEEAFPLPDVALDQERTLTWYGLKSFGAEEPKILLKKELSDIASALQTYGPMALLTIVGICSGIVYYKSRNRKKRRAETEITQIPLEIESDETKVVRLLRTMGGRAYQSTLTEKTGFSKSKTSQLLKQMEKSGMVKRKLFGREKLVILIDQETDKFQ